MIDKYSDEELLSIFKFDGTVTKVTIMKWRKGISQPSENHVAQILRWEWEPYTCEINYSNELAPIAMA